MRSIRRNVSSTLFEEITGRFLRAGNPSKIILFGSRARNEAREDGDYDFLIVEDSMDPRHKRAAKYFRTLRGMRFSKDILVWTPEEIAEWRDVPNAFITAVLKEGIVLYEK